MIDTNKQTDLDSNAEVMRQYFEGIEQLLSESSAPHRIYHLDIEGQFIKLIFVGLAPEAGMLESLRRILTDDAGETSETFYIWTDRISNYAPKGCDISDGRWIYQCEGCNMILSLQYGYLKARFDLKKTSFICFDPDIGLPADYISHPFFTELHWWAQRRKMLLVHSASVGIDGKGVLISAPSGKGKSTLALACMLKGMDYVSDDYLLLNTEGSATARPIYSTGYLTSDSLELLPVLKQHIIVKNSERGKYLIDLTPFESQFVSALPLKAIVFPELCGNSFPSIVPTAPGIAIVQMVSAAANQKRAERNPEFLRTLLNQVKGLPSYKIYLTRDAEANAKVLEAFCRNSL
ncbi:MAG: hypothetical protein JXN10_05950 [Clostridia bacterium]|nr:hypothetical protein [Clostridia bacterium]MBN2883051.1 hypothetical protein [Clostridia bacterium]